MILHYQYFLSQIFYARWFLLTWRTIELTDFIVCSPFSILVSCEFLLRWNFIKGSHPRSTWHSGISDGMPCLFPHEYGEAYLIGVSIFLELLEVFVWSVFNIVSRKALGNVSVLGDCWSKGYFVFIYHYLRISTLFFLWKTRCKYVLSVKLAHYFPCALC